MVRKIATADRVGRDEMLDFARTRHRGTLVTLRYDRRPQAMRKQDKSLIRVTIDRWGPIATGGFPPGHE